MLEVEDIASEPVAGYRCALGKSSKQSSDPQSKASFRYASDGHGRKDLAVVLSQKDNDSELILKALERGRAVGILSPWRSTRFVVAFSAVERYCGSCVGGWLC